MARYPADHAGLEILPFDRCLELLTTVPVGRVSFFADRLSRLGLCPWVSTANRPFWIRIHPTSISGRRIPDPGETSEEQG